MKTIKVLALSKDGTRENAHCPIVTPENRKVLEKTFNHFVREEQIIELEIDAKFKCPSRNEVCKYCPF